MLRDQGAIRGSARDRYAARTRAARDHVVEPPLEIRDRVGLAELARLLLHAVEVLAGDASELGYASNVAFAKAFKRSMGIPPGEYPANQR